MPPGFNFSGWESGIASMQGILYLNIFQAWVLC